MKYNADKLSLIRTFNHYVGGEDAAVARFCHAHQEAMEAKTSSSKATATVATAELLPNSKPDAAIGEPSKADKRKAAAAKKAAAADAKAAAEGAPDE